MKTIDIHELQNIYYLRFKEIHDFLVSNHISYYAVGGTLLGAIRNKGFIPWDDDMDIAMDRFNYEKFLKISSQLDAKHFITINYKNRKTIEHALTKICLVGVKKKQSALRKNYDNHYHIDVFPMDFIAADEDVQKSIVFKVNSIKKKLYYKSIRISKIKWYKRPLIILYKFFLMFFSCRGLCKRLDYLVQVPSKSGFCDKTQLWTSSGVYSFQQETHHVSEFGNPLMCAFGSTKIIIPEKYDIFLSKVYGVDYLTPQKRNAFYDGPNAILTDDFVD